MIITFRLSAQEFKEGIAHRSSCHLCDDLTHLYMEIAELAEVEVVISDLDDQPDNEQLAGQLTRLTAELNRRRGQQDVPRDNQERALKVIRQAWDKHEEQVLNGS
jgi:hypothetical protein